MIASVKRLLILLFPFFFLGSCSWLSRDGGSRKTTVLVSIAPYKNMVEAVCGDLVHVIVAIPPDVDPHNWEPTIRQMSAFKDVDVWIKSGESFEAKLSRSFLGFTQKIKTVSITSIIPDHLQLHTKDGSLDTHFWLSPTLDQTIVRGLGTFFKTVFPSSEATIQTNTSSPSK